jgi:hypothetical protein
MKKRFLDHEIKSYKELGIYRYGGRTRITFNNSHEFAKGGKNVAIRQLIEQTVH